MMGLAGNRGRGMEGSLLGRGARIEERPCEDVVGRGGLQLEERAHIGDQTSWHLGFGLQHCQEIHFCC